MKKQTTVAIVGGSSLLGRDLQDLIQHGKLPWRVRQFSGDPLGAGVLAATPDEEATYLEPITAAAIEEAALTFLAGSLESSTKALELHPGGWFIDLTGVAGDGFTLCAPRIGLDPEASRLAVAHPAAVGIAFLLSKMRGLERAVITICEPASELGLTGVGELQKQTTNLLAFKPLPKEIFDAQIAFNVLPQLGEDAPLQLQTVEDRIDRDLLALNPELAAKASIRLLQTPVFHGYSMHAWVRLSAAVDSIEPFFANDPLIDFRPPGTEPPSNAGSAQQDGFIVGAIHKDRRDPHAWWIAMAFDNLRIAASNALAAAKQIL